jgi:hypothetical protein
MQHGERGAKHVERLGGRFHRRDGDRDAERAGALGDRALVGEDDERLEPLVAALQPSAEGDLRAYTGGIAHADRKRTPAPVVPAHH